jgi:hypothetical protein
MPSDLVRAVVLTLPGEVSASGPLIAFIGTLTVRLRSLFGRTVTDTSSDLPPTPRKVTLATPDMPEPTIRILPPWRARPRLAHDFRHLTRRTFAVGV